MGGRLLESLGARAVPVAACRAQKARSKDSATGTRSRVARVRAEYANQLDYSGSVQLPICFFVFSLIPFLAAVHVAPLRKADGVAPAGQVKRFWTSSRAQAQDSFHFFQERVHGSVVERVIPIHQVPGSIPGAPLCRLVGRSFAQQHQWSSGRIHRCHRSDLGSIPS